MKKWLLGLIVAFFVLFGLGCATHTQGYTEWGIRVENNVVFFSRSTPDTGSTAELTSTVVDDLLAPEPEGP